MSEIKEQGIIDYCSGKKITDNPHKEEPQKSEWEDGWISEINKRCAEMQNNFDSEKAYEEEK